MLRIRLVASRSVRSSFKYESKRHCRHAADQRMKLIGLAALLVSVALPASLGAAEPALPAKRDFLIFLLAGQSNMAGRGKPLETQDQTAHSRVLVLGKEQTWAPAVDPLHWDKPPVVGVGLGLSFGKAVTEALPEKTVGLVPAAFGGSAISEWAKGAKHYTNAVERTKLALRDGTLAGILWHQGESDATAERAAVYASKLDRLIEDLRIDLASPEAPFIAGTLADNPSRAGGEQVNAALRSLPDRLKRTGCVEAKGLQLSADGVHFNAASYREFGRRYAQEWLRQVSN
jgi:hypothetical protein